MYKHIVIATDGSELAGKGLEQGLELAAAVGAQVTIVTASERWTPADAGVVWGGSASMLEEYRTHVTDQANEVLAAAGARADQLGVRHESVYVAERYPADAILETAAGRGADLIVMASHGRRGLNRLLIGSQTNAVIAHSTIPVLVVR
ncbi:universal stress protein [Novilysobacter avium]|uniref:Universal stress protein n=1 Tax=Novilysobacter avium TaxID=2781023 RepID=A0A7S6ZUR8_9GAMM|nr:universal stress protein [Lysobacter avium]QOW22265.1 universal stress protein [Lysobacter avium]